MSERVRLVEVGESGSKLERTLTRVDAAADAVVDLLKNGLR
jgi:hypothetical protein